MRDQGHKLLGQGVLDKAPVTGVLLLGKQLPDWQGAVALACQTHELFSTMGITSTDIALTDNGPKVSEVNSNPHHMLFQRARGVGFLHPANRWALVATLAVRGIVRRTKGLPLP